MKPSTAMLDKAAERLRASVGRDDHAAAASDLAEYCRILCELEAGERELRRQQAFDLLEWARRTTIVSRSGLAASLKPTRTPSYAQRTRRSCWSIEA